MRLLDLFSGIGGFSLAARWLGWETVAFCEKEKFCQQVLNKHWPEVPIIDDIRDIERFKQYAGAVDVLVGGFPCQPFSTAGKRRGNSDDRYLWPEMLGVIRAVKPRWVVAENVTGIVRLALDDVCADLENEGYTVRTYIVPACAKDAQHRRDRVWIIAHANGQWKQQSQGNIEEGRKRSCDGCKENVPHTQHNGRNGSENKTLDREGSVGEKARENKLQQPKGAGSIRTPAASEPRADRRAVQCSPERTSQPRFCGGFDGVPAGVDRDLKIKDRTKRIKALGNAIVPQVAHEIFRLIDDLENASLEYLW